LAAAFAGLLLVIGIAAFAAWRNARNAQERVADLHRSHMQAGSALAAVRTNVYVIAILTRDLLLEPGPERARAALEQFNTVRSRAEDSFQVLNSVTHDDDLRFAIQQLRSGFDQYCIPTQEFFERALDAKRALGTSILKQRVRSREQTFAMASQVEQMIASNFLRERERVTTADRDSRSSLAWTTALTLLLGFAISGVTFARMTALERQSDAAHSELRLLSSQLRITQEQERKYLSRELHDQVGQSLTGVRMELAAMARLHGETETELFSRIVHAKGTVEQTLRVVRDIAMLLRPSMLDDLGLTPALVWLAKEVGRSSGMEVHADVDPVADLLPDAHRTCLYRVVQEALTNAARHSGARKVELSLRASGAFVTCTVVDDGRGFPLVEPLRKGLGMLGMEERIRELGGSVRVSSAAGRGTRLEILLPRPEEPRGPNDDTNSDCGRSRDRADRAPATA
jgi:signal transduction histidine kinase